MNRTYKQQLLVTAVVLNLLLMGAAGYLTTTKVVQPTDGSPRYFTDANGSSSMEVHEGNQEQESVFPGANKNPEALPVELQSGQRSGSVLSAQASSESPAGQSLPPNQAQGIVIQTYNSAGRMSSPGFQYNAYPASGSSRYNLQQTEGSASGAAFSSQQRIQAAAAQPGQVPVPLAFTDTSGLNLSDDQQQQIADLQQQFVDAVGGENQNPSDPAYLGRWMSATERSNVLFKLEFGIQAFLLQQMAANHNPGS